MVRIEGQFLEGMTFRVGIVLMILISPVSCKDRQLSSNEKALVGIWQEIPEVASGWANVYRFFDNREFVFHYSQMICDKRTVSYAGTWELTDDRNLKFKISRKTIIEGGKLVPAMESCGSDFEIEGGEVREVEVKEVKTISVTETSIDRNNRDLETITFDGESFWKMTGDPEKY